MPKAIILDVETKPITHVPNDYKAWLLGQPDVDEYLRKALLA